MGLSDAMAKLKADLLLKASLEDVGKESDKREKISIGIKNIPVKRMIDQVNYLKNNLLPLVEKKSGKKSADYEFFKEVADSLLHSIVLCDRYESLSGRYTTLRVTHMITKEHLCLVEDELLKFETMEDLLYTDALNHVAAGIMSRAADLLKKK